MRTFFLALVFLSLVPTLATAQPVSVPPPVTIASSRDAPVPVPEPSEKALRYFRSGTVLWVINQIWGLAVPLLFLFSGLSARLRDLARSLGRRWFFMIAIYGILFALVTFLIDFPLAFYQGYLRQHAYGLSNQTMSKWFSDWFKALALNFLGVPLILWIPFFLLKKSPRRWWLYSGLATIPLTIFLIFVTPLWIDPLFNKYGPMKNKPLEGQILSLARKAGIDGSRVFEVEKSVDTKTVNAYVTGFMGSKRIVLWDTILQKLDEKEILVVMGHEMGHFVLRHVAQIIAFASLVTILGLYFAHLAAGALIRRYGNSWGFSDLSDVAALPLILLLLSVATFMMTPALLAVTRHNEHESDRFGLEITRDNRSAATAFVKLQFENLSVPRPGALYKFFRASHPPLGERIDFANQYRPWREGKPLKYERFFRK